MAISYPLDVPETIGMESISLRAVNSTAISRSPFSFHEQIVDWGGERWEASITIPNGHRDLTEDWVGMILALKGNVGTFLLGDPLGATPRGEAKNYASDTLVGSGVTDDVITFSGAEASVTDYLKRGDYIQIGSGSSATLHKAVENASSGAGGGVTVTVWPAPRRAISSLAVEVFDTKGVFRLANPISEWAINNANQIGLSFEAVEVIQ